MTAESVKAYLGVVLAGCVVVSIADSFSAAQIQTRYFRPPQLESMITLPWHPRCCQSNRKHAIDQPLSSGSALASWSPKLHARHSQAQWPAHQDHYLSAQIIVAARVHARPGLAQGSCPSHAHPDFSDQDPPGNHYNEQLGLAVCSVVNSISLHHL